MTHLPQDATDEQILRFIDGWAALLEAEDYQAAYDYTAHDPKYGGTPDLIRQAIKEYTEAASGQRVTVAGTTQHRSVIRWPLSDKGSVGTVWYDLNIDGEASDLTATFYLGSSEAGLTVKLDDIDVM